MRDYDAIIVGGGIGGLTAAALLSDAGKKVLLLEQHNEPGGCAATFSHNGYRFDAGATIGCGFQEDGPMAWLAARLDINWPTYPLPTAWKYIDGKNTISLDPKRREILRRFPESQSFWKEQEAVADKLWGISASILSQYHLNRLQQLSTLARSLPKKLLHPKIIQLSLLSVRRWLRLHNLEKNREFCRFIDAQLLISSQTTSPFANALFGAIALDLPRKSPCSVQGGMGTIARILSEAVKERGGIIHCKEKALSLETIKGKVTGVVSDKNNYSAKEFIINGSSASLAALLKKPIPRDWKKKSRSRWGAFILHMGLPYDLLAGLNSHHLQIIDNSNTTLAEGHSLFLSSSHPQDISRAQPDRVAVSISTHTDVDLWWKAYQKGIDAYREMKTEYTEKMLSLLERHVPGVYDTMDFCLAGTPISYARYTGRHLGLVGGYTQNGIFPPRQNLFGLKNCSLVGDANFPGQSLAGVTVGAVLKAEQILRRT